MEGLVPVQVVVLKFNQTLLLMIIPGDMLLFQEMKPVDKYGFMSTVSSMEMEIVGLDLKIKPFIALEPQDNFGAAEVIFTLMDPLTL
jgi:hypothetical protein